VRSNEKLEKLRICKRRDSLFYIPIIGGAAAMIVFALVTLLKAPLRATLIALGILLFFVLLWFGLGLVAPDAIPDPIILLVLGFLVCLVAGIPIAFALAFAALIFIWTDGSLPIVIYSQEIESGVDNFVLLAVPFFIMAGLTMDVNGMSARPSFKYLSIIFVTLLIIMFVPWITLSLPHALGVGQ
jgi:hypothetical protein